MNLTSYINNNVFASNIESICFQVYIPCLLSIIADSKSFIIKNLINGSFIVDSN